MATIGESLLRYDEICTDKITPVITAVYSTLFENTEGFPWHPGEGHDTVSYGMEPAGCHSWAIPCQSGDRALALPIYLFTSLATSSL